MRLLIGLILAGISAGQAVPPSRSVKPTETIVHVRGCLQGHTLFLTEDPGFDVPAGRIELDASRSVKRQLKEHNHHLEEFVGVLRTQSPNHTVAVKEKRGEKTRVYVGTSQTRGDLTSDVSATPTLRVREVTHVAPRCGG